MCNKECRGTGRASRLGTQLTTHTPCEWRAIWGYSQEPLVAGTCVYAPSCPLDERGQPIQAVRMAAAMAKANTPASVLEVVLGKDFLMECLTTAKLDEDMREDICDAMEMNELSVLSLGELGEQEAANRLFLMAEEASRLLTACRTSCLKAGVDFGDGEVYDAAEEQAKEAAVAAAAAEAVAAEDAKIAASKAATTKAAEETAAHKREVEEQAKKRAADVVAANAAAAAAGDGGQPPCTPMRNRRSMRMARLPAMTACACTHACYLLHTRACTPQRVPQGYTR
jgi:hypothetical protein